MRLDFISVEKLQDSSTKDHKEKNKREKKWKQKEYLEINRKAQEKYQLIIAYGLDVDPDSHRQSKKQQWQQQTFMRQLGEFEQTLTGCLVRSVNDI